MSNKHKKNYQSTEAVEKRKVKGQQDKSFYQNIKNIFFCISHSWKYAKIHFLFALINILTSTLQPFVLLIVPAKIIDAMVILTDWKVILRLILFMIIVEILIATLNQLVSYCKLRSNFNSGVKHNVACSKAFLYMDFEKLENGSVRDLGFKVHKNFFPAEYPYVLSSFIVNIIQLVGYAYIVSTLQSLILLIIVVFIFLNSLISKKREKMNYEFESVITKASRRFNYLFSVMINFDYGKEIRINNISEWLKSRYFAETQKYMKLFDKRQNKELKISLVAVVLSVIQTIFMYGYCAYKAIFGYITVGSFSMQLGAIAAFIDSFNGITSKYNALLFKSAYAEEYKKFVSITTPSRFEANGKFDNIENGQYEFEFKGVSFKYPNTDIYVLKNINIKINAGECLSIVGYNGAGKTTFIKLLCRLYDPTEGKILCNGIDIRTIDYNIYREVLSVVFQDFCIFAMSVKDNVILGRNYNEDKLVTSIFKSGLANKIEMLPYKYDTQIEKRFDERGIEFSGGESQKLACARAYYKDAPAVILDEPTASLDPIAENGLYERFNSIMENKTSIYISHRLSSAKFCDKVAVFVSGEIVEYGIHADLIKQNGVYAEMFAKQSEYYIKEGDEE